MNDNDITQEKAHAMFLEAKEASHSILAYCKQTTTGPTTAVMAMTIAALGIILSGEIGKKSPDDMDPVEGVMAIKRSTDRLIALVQIFAKSMTENMGARIK